MNRNGGEGKIWREKSEDKQREKKIIKEGNGNGIWIFAAGRKQGDWDKKQETIKLKWHKA